MNALNYTISPQMFSVHPLMKILQIILLALSATKCSSCTGVMMELKKLSLDFVENLGIEATILHEQPSGGRTIIEKVREVHAGDACFRYRLDYT